MTDLLQTALTLAALLAGLVAGLAALVRFAANDRFAGPGTGYRHRDELGPFCFRRRPA